MTPYLTPHISHPISHTPHPPLQVQLEETNRELIDTRSELTTARSGASSPRVLLGVAPHACPAPPLSAASDLGSLRPSPLCVESGGGDRSAGGAAASKLSPSHVSPSKQAQSAVPSTDSPSSSCSHMRCIAN